MAAFAFGSERAPCAPPFEIDPEQPLARAVAKIVRDHGGEADDAALEADAADVPRPLQEALAQIVLAAGEAQAGWNELAKVFTPAELEILSFEYTLDERPAHATGRTCNRDFHSRPSSNMLRRVGSCDSASASACVVWPPAGTTSPSTRAS